MHRHRPHTRHNKQFEFEYKFDTRSEVGERGNALELRSKCADGGENKRHSRLGEGSNINVGVNVVVPFLSRILKTPPGRSGNFEAVL